MTVSTTTNTAILQGNGSTTVFSFNFIYGLAGGSNLSIYYTPTGGTPQLLPNSQYTLNLNAPAGGLWGIGGTVTYPTVASGNPAIPTGSTLTIQRQVPNTQNTSISNQGASYPNAIETALDLLCMEIQQISNRTTQFRGVWVTNAAYSVGDIVQDGANGLNTMNFYICNNANTSGVWATDLANGLWSISINVQAIIGSIGISAAMTPVVQAPTLAAGRAAFGLGASAVLNQSFSTVQTITAAATTDLGSKSNNIIQVTGNTGITSFGNSANVNNPFYLLEFTGTPLLTNSAGLVLPGGVNYQVAAGDVAIAIFSGSSTWTLFMLRANGQAVSMSGAEITIASAATTDLGTAGTNAVVVTGTTGITSFGSTANINNPIYFIRFTGILTLTNSGNLILPTAANITTAAGDTAVVKYEGSGVWRVIGYLRASGTPLVGAGAVIVRPRSFTSSGTYTPDAHLLWCFVRGVGAGGGGSGNGATSAASGGAAGGYAEATLTAAQIGASKAVTIGAHGSGGNSAAGSAGGGTSLGSLLVVGGGAGGNGTASSPTGGTATTGDTLVPGAPGGVRPSAAIGGQGGSGPFGNGVYGITDSTAGTGKGSGGTGCSSNNGGDGTDGYMIILEYCSQ